MIWESVKGFGKKEFKSSEDVLKELLDEVEMMDKVDRFIKQGENYSWGIGKGVVLYKTRGQKIEPELYIQVAGNPVQIDSFDGLPGEIFCLLLSSKDNSVHLDYISLLYRLLNFASLRERLKKSDSIQEVKKLFKNEERGLSK